MEPLDGPANIVVQSELVANEQLPSVAGDPRVASALESPLQSEEHLSRETEAVLIHRTRRSGLRMAAAMDHVISGTSKVRIATETSPDSARVVVTDALEPGQRLRLVKLVAYGWSLERTVPALRDQVAAALAAARQAGWDGLLADQRRYLDDFWARADVEISGDSELQQAVRFALFHVLQAGARGREARHSCQGTDGHRLRRPLVLGHRDVRPARPDAHRPDCRGRRVVLAPFDDSGRAAARARVGPGRRRLSMAHHPRRGMLGLLARREPLPFTSTPTSPMR